MRILYIVPSLQHPQVRGANRHYHFVKELSKRHQITLLSLVRSKVKPEALEEMRSLTENLLTFNVNGESDSSLAAGLGKVPVIGNYVAKSIKMRAGVREMRQAFLELVRKESFDIVLFHGKSVFPVIADWSGLPIVTDFCDATSLRIRTSMRYNNLLKRPFYYWKLRRMAQLEKKLIEKSSTVAFISNRDREAILGPDDRSEILPLGVDHEFWSRSRKGCDKNCIVFTGVMDYAPNHDAAICLIENILPKLRRQLSDFKIMIVGRDPKPELLARAKQHPEIVVTGFVEDVRPYLEQATVFAAPVRFASGTQNKVLEAMAMEVPVVATRVVSDGLYIDEYGAPPLLLADDDQQFADAIAKLLGEANERNRLAREGQTFVKSYFNWTSSAARLERMCERALSERQAFK